MSIFGDGNRLTNTALEQLDEKADMIQCECPTHLIEILRKVREFGAYTNSCIKKFPEDANTHKWLYGAAQNIDTLLSGTIAQLARHEGFINENNEFTERPVKPTDHKL